MSSHIYVFYCSGISDINLGVTLDLKKQVKKFNRKNVYFLIVNNNYLKKYKKIVVSCAYLYIC